MNENYDEQQDYAEVDIPLNSENIKSVPCNPTTKLLKSKEIDKLEHQAKYFDAMDKHVYKKKGFDLLVGCGIAYFLLVVFDTIVINAFSWKTSVLSEGFIELLKFIMSTLIGFVFSETKNKSD